MHQPPRVIDLAASRPEPGPRLADRLAAARGARFVGRVAELELFRAALAAAEPPFAVLHVHGPGGIGKTTLVQAYAGLAAQAGRPVVRLDARDLEPVPEQFLAALGQALGTAATTVEAVAARWPDNGVLLVDPGDGIAALDAWLRDAFLPRLPARTLVVIAGRQPPAPAWSTDLDWAPLTRTLALRNLPPEASRSYLALRGVALPRHAEALAATHGHPLALSLVADALASEDGGAPFDLGREPDIVRTLLRKLLDDVPSAQHRLALDACATIPALTEPALAAALACDDAHPVFEWLAGLSFIEHGPRGLVPHDLAREVLYADSRWRNPDLRRTLNARLLAHLYQRFQQAQGVERQRIWFDLIYVQRYNAGLRPYFAWGAATAYADPVRPDDEPAILDMTLRHEGPESAAIARHWLARQRDAFLAFRDLAGRLVGFMAMLRLEAATDEDRRVDPAVGAALDYLRDHGPVRPGERVTHGRFWMDRDAYQSARSTMNVLAANSSACWTSLPGLAWCLCTMADPAHFAPMFESIHLWRAPQADFEVGGRRYGVFAHDWRVEPVAQWMMTKVDRASCVDAAPAPEPPLPLLVLSEAGFADAVRQALRNYARGDDALAANPLLRTRLLLGADGAPRGPQALRALLREAVQSLDGTPRDRKLHRAVWHTHFEPAPTQERAAERLDLPFNTYRYQLARGTERITEWLWRREIGG